MIVPMMVLSSIRTTLSSLLCNDRDDGLMVWQVVSALTALSSIVTIPLVQYRPLYGFSIGYGASVAFIALVLIWMQCPPNQVMSTNTTTHIDPVKTFLTSPERLLLTSAAWYGLRLATYLLWRDWSGWTPRNEMIRTGRRLVRIPFAIALSLLYGCLTSPLVYVMQNPPPTGTWMHGVTIVSSYAAWIAALSEAISDFHKSWCKHRAADSKSAAASFVGPTRGLYGFTRHPNYTSEVLYWTSVWLCGTATYGTRWGAWISSTIGWIAIVMIMDGSTRRLEEYQRTSYQDQTAYKEWVHRVPYPLIPGIRSVSILRLPNGIK